VRSERGTLCIEDLYNLLYLFRVSAESMHRLTEAK